MKKFFVLLIAMVTFFTVAACTTDDDEKVLEMMWFSDGNEADVMASILQKYYRETGVVIMLNPIGWNVYETRLGTMIDGDDQPALIRTTEGVMNNFQDHMVELDGVFDEEGFNNIFRNAAGNPLGLPMDVTANGLYVNFDLLDKYDVNYPTRGDDDIWDWDEFITEMSKLKGQDDVSYPGVFDFQGHRFMPLMYQQGITMWDEPLESMNLKSQEAQDALQILMDLYADEIISKEVFSTGAQELMMSGRYGFHMSGNWFVSFYEDNADFNWGVVPMPTGPEGQRATVLGGKSLSAVKGSGMEEEAKAFIEWFSQPEIHDEFNQFVPFLSARVGADIDFGDLDPVLGMFQDEISATPTTLTADWVYMTQVPGIYPMINDMTNAAAYPNGKSALDILTELEQKILDELDD